jgi:PIN domain nuclease of toxin-antitoxin system
VKLLLDTHAFIWWDNGRLPKGVVRRIQRAEDVLVSAVTAWEIAIKSALGRMAAKGNVSDAIADYGFTALPISLAHGDATRALPEIHKDPFDRMLVAQASVEDLVIVSADEVLGQYGVPIAWE